MKILSRKYVLVLPYLKPEVAFSMYYSTGKEGIFFQIQFPIIHKTWKVAPCLSLDLQGLHNIHLGAFNCEIWTSYQVQCQFAIVYLIRRSLQAMVNFVPLGRTYKMNIIIESSYHNDYIWQILLHYNWVNRISFKRFSKGWW
jgi:hypothetical protein